MDVAAVGEVEGDVDAAPGGHGRGVFLHCGLVERIDHRHLGCAAGLGDLLRQPVEGVLGASGQEDRGTFLAKALAMPEPTAPPAP
ncbi:hypothetical protein GCM10027610_033370 [Dactylosporangium cerinum]